MFGEVLLHIRAKKLYLPYRTQHLQVLQHSIECISQLQFVTCEQNRSDVTMNTNGIFAYQNLNVTFFKLYVLANMYFVSYIVLSSKF